LGRGPEAPRRRREPARPRDETVLERKDLVAACLGPPQLHETADDVGMLTGEVARLGRVVVEAEERPVVAVEVVAPGDALALDRELGADVVGRRLPAGVVDAAAAQHLEVLRPARRL